VDLLLNEFILAGDFDEVCRTVLELNCPWFSHELIKRLLIKALSIGNDTSRERVSRLLVMLRFNLMNLSNAISTGFQIVLDALEDIQIDAPYSRSVFAKFIARAVKDEVLTPRFVLDSESSVLDEAKKLLSAPYSSSTIFNCWNNMNNTMGVEDMKNEVKARVQDFLISQDVQHSIEDFTIDESLKSFCHEVVYRLIVSVLTEKINGKKENDSHYVNLVCELLEKLFRKGKISIFQLHGGTNRVGVAVRDISLDAPYAEEAFFVISSRLSYLGSE
jgi:programmed cell death protein 4